MDAFYYSVFGGLAAVVAAMELSKTSRDRVATSSPFNAFKNNYLLVYSLMMAGDWLQGPYVYYLYSQYGFDKGDIGRLFIAGFGSSMLFGTIVGSLADKRGRKRACVTYCITYILSCITKHSPEYKVLMVGRILGGISTSLLFSAFESWLVAEHNKRGFDPQWLSVTFAKAIFLGNGLIAIVSGLFANLLADNLGFGPVAPFDAAACCLAIGMAIILSSWSENYGDPSDSKDLITQFKGAAAAIASDEKIALLGAIQSLFEGSMYTFVFLWTPALSPNDEDIPHGFIFATFMVSSMLGSSIASRLMARGTLKVESYMQIVFAISAFTLLLPIISNFLVAPSTAKGGSISFGSCIQLLGFCVFEACVGIFWPSIMKMRSQYIPEEARSTIMNFFRIPLNIFVCIVLYNVNAFPITIMFGMCKKTKEWHAYRQKEEEKEKRKTNEYREIGMRLKGYPEEEVRKARKLVSSFIRSAEEVEEKIEEAAEKGELTELVLMVIWNRLDLARKDDEKDVIRSLDLLYRRIETEILKRESTPAMRLLNDLLNLHDGFDDEGWLKKCRKCMIDMFPREDPFSMLVPSGFDMENHQGHIGLPPEDDDVLLRVDFVREVDLLLQEVRAEQQNFQPSEGFDPEAVAARLRQQEKQTTIQLVEALLELAISLKW